MTRRPAPSRRLSVAAIALAFFAGLAADHAASAARSGPARPYQPLDVFSDVLAHVENSYVEEVDEQDLVYGAIDGMIGRLDPHSSFMRPETNRQMREETAGEFDGLGLEVTLEGGAVTVVSPLADSPGERGGVRPGDRILAIDGVPTKELALAEVIRRMKGPAGTKAELALMRDGFSAPQKLVLVRDRVRTQSVELRLADPARRHAYVRVRSFQARTDRALAKALDEARAAAGGELRGLVLDLRNNPGGLLDQAVRVTDLFLASGVIVSTEGRGKRNVEVERAHEKGTEPPYPLVVLVNKGTASASEIVAGALQDHGRAVIMGTSTFGKGSVQTIIDLEDGSGLKLTVARYYTPKHRSIQELGISPDVLVADAAPGAVVPAGGERELARHLRNDTATASLSPAVSPAALPPHGVSPGQDFLLETALDYLRAAEVAGAPGAPARRAMSKRE
jgi:carboxyl-terminal processing protease